jgi:p-aminobenzoyl-glutamate transporter AbgT
MCKEMSVFLVNKVVDPKGIIGKKCWAKEKEERHKELLTPQKTKKNT